jgi:Terpene cyclase DEP1
MRRPLLLLTLFAFGALTAAALWQHGYWGLIAPLLQTLAGGQVLVDLVIALTLVMLWMARDAKARGRRIWPWIAVTLVAGSFGPLMYLLTRKPVTT